MGQAVLEMFEAWIGPETFRRGVRGYIREHEWKNATGGDLWSALSRAAGRDMIEAMTSFIESPGVPMVRAELLPDGRLRLSQ